MKEVQNIGKRMPYAESEDYLNGLISQATEQAILQGARGKEQGASGKTRVIRMWMAAAAAALVLIGGVAITYFHQNDTEELVAEQTTTGPIDHFLDNLTDDEAQQLAYYEIEDIPEYY